MQRAQEMCERGFDAWVAESDSVTRAQLQVQRTKFARDHEEATSLELKSRTGWETLETELEKYEAHFAQSEMLTHIQSNRRRLTPLNMARAMAGLPLVTARFSSES